MTKLVKKPTITKKIRTGDKVVAIAGNNRGQVGIVKSLKGETVVVQGLNVRKKHVKRTQEAPQGRIIDIERPIHVSNVKVCVDGDTAARLKVRTNGQGQRNLVYKNGDKETVYRSIKKPK
ncbi:MAG: 50S ribosomal protein L24 [Parachlamydiaceae bacterium]|nr:50S ribosomal protein L24 [Parachlamydiaceae bacterium]